MLVCEQITCVCFNKFHNFRPARKTEHTDFDCFVHLVVEFPRMDLSSRDLSQIVLRREPIDFTGIADTPCRRLPFAMTFGEVIFASSWG